METVALKRQIYGEPISQKTISDIVSAIISHFKTDKIILFGSYASGRPTPDSDLDLLVDLEPQRSLLDLIAFEQELAEALDVRVDALTDGSLHERIRERAGIRLPNEPSRRIQPAFIGAQPSASPSATRTKPRKPVPSRRELLRVCSELRIAVMNAVQFPLDPAITKHQGAASSPWRSWSRPRRRPTSTSSSIRISSSAARPSRAS